MTNKLNRGEHKDERAVGSCFPIYMTYQGNELRVGLPFNLNSQLLAVAEDLYLQCFADLGGRVSNSSI